MTPPITPQGAPPPPTDDAQELASLAFRHWPALLKGAALIVAGVVAWEALSNRVERVEASNGITQQTVGQLRDLIREDSNRTDTRLRELDRSREEHAKSLVRLEGRLDSMEKTMDRVDKTTTLILDRLGDSSAAGRRGSVAATNP